MSKIEERLISIFCVDFFVLIIFMIAQNLCGIIGAGFILVSLSIIFHLPSGEKKDE